MTTSNNDLKILQGKTEGDSYKAANRLAAHLEETYDIVSYDESLTDWLAGGDYDGDETITSLLVEWRELTKGERQNEYAQRQ